MTDLESMYKGASVSSGHAKKISMAMAKSRADYISLFVCYNCKGSLFSRRFVKMDSKPWCVLCYNDNFTSTCTRCNDKIDVDDNDVEYHGEHWHKRCFFCSECKESLFQKTFGYHDGDIFCSDCFKKVNNRCCEACERPFKGGTKVVIYKGQQIHPECFVCYHCKHPIEGASSQRSDNVQDHMMHDGEIYCVPCYEDMFAKKCGGCNKAVIDGDSGVYHMGEPYHKACLVCEQCEGNLSDVRYYAYEGHKYCMDCFDKPLVFGKNCLGCGEKITGVCDKSFFVVDDATWHDKCFKCCRCSDKLNPEEPFVCPSERQGETSDIYCERCGVEMLTDMNVLVDRKFDFIMN